MDSKTYAAAMAALQVISQNQSQKNEIEQYKLKTKTDKEVLADNKSYRDDNFVFQALKSTASQIDDSWTDEMFKTYYKEISDAQGDLHNYGEPKKSWSDEFTISYNSLENLVKNKQKGIQNVRKANEEFESFSNKVLDIYQAEGPGQMSQGLNAVLQLEKDINDNYRKHLKGTYKQAYERTIRYDLPKIKSMIKEFNMLDTDSTDDVFTPDIKNFTSSQSVIYDSQTGEQRMLHIKPEQARNFMLQAYSYFQAGDLTNAQKFYNMSIKGYKPVAPKLKGNINTGHKEEQFKVVQMGDSSVITDIYDSSKNTYTPYGRITDTPINESLKTITTRSALQEKWSQKALEWGKDKITTDPFNILTEKVLTTFFDRTNPTVSNVSELRAAISGTNKIKRNGQVLPINQIVDDMIKGTGYSVEMGRNALGEVLIMLEDSANMSKAWANIDNFAEEFTSREEGINLVINKEGEARGKAIVQQLHNLYEESSGLRMDNSTFGTSMNDIYKDVYMIKDKRGTTVSDLSAYKFTKKEPHTENFMLERMDKAQEFISKTLSSYTGDSEGDSYSSTELMAISVKGKNKISKAKSHNALYQMFTKFEKRGSFWEDIQDDLQDSWFSNNTEEERSGSILAWELVAEDFHRNYNKKYYNTETGFYNVEDRVMNRLLDGTPVGEGTDFLPGMERGTRTNIGRYYNADATSGKIVINQDNEKLITAQNSADLEFAEGIYVDPARPGVIITPFGPLTNQTLLDYEMTKNSVEIIGMYPNMKDDEMIWAVYGQFTKEAKAYREKYGENYPIYSTGRKP